jgi:dolichyl-phosphate beta-glucosyltransferase
MITLVFALYNEEKRIYLLEQGLKEYNNQHQLIKEIIFVDDGSTDSTVRYLRQMQSKYPQFNIKIIPVQTNRGKGNAVKEGIMTVTQPWVLCNDADLSYSMDQIDEWVNMEWIDFTKINEVYFGSRELGKDNQEMKLFLHRRIIGRIYAFFIQLITGISVRDTQCGYKLYPSSLAKQVFNNISEERFAFDVEVHFLLKKLNISINFLPVRCIDIKGSKVHLISDSWQMFRALFRIKKRHG